MVVLSTENLLDGVRSPIAETSQSFHFVDAVSSTSVNVGSYISVEFCGFNRWELSWNFHLGFYPSKCSLRQVICSGQSKVIYPRKIILTKVFNTLHKCTFRPVPPAGELRRPHVVLCFVPHPDAVGAETQGDTWRAKEADGLQSHAHLCAEFH